ncbi:MAG TPA: DUF1588 domain-containing protein [Verrucomicrobiales bacterium]|nr:DUF1588 domain-containing protein [Verrucomicrobiales bacterium]
MPCHLFKITLTLFFAAVLAVSADEFETFLKPLFKQNCTKCHGEKKTKGKVNLHEISKVAQLLADPKLIDKMIGAIDSFEMPPEDEPELSGKDRERLLAGLKKMLREAATEFEVKDVRLRRLNRFQYNNSLRDLFDVDKDIFGMPEKMMTRYGNYLTKNQGKMPDEVNVACLTLRSPPGFKNVEAFPKDLRASHGFDNQANQLTLSPLLLDGFLKLSVSILVSPDFNEKTVGIWKAYFAPPLEGTELRPEVEKRLVLFLGMAFRRPVDQPTLDRYVNYTMAKIESGTPFTDAMKKTTSGALSSPLFLYRYAEEAGGVAHYELASKLSFFLWGSAPDADLLRAARDQELSKPESLKKTLDRMLADPKIERFLDTFPAQWMQLENLMAATPDPKKFRFFTIDKSNPASTQMVLEPLLLFDAVFIEDRPVIELIQPAFSYRSDFLTSWYTEKFEVPKIDTSDVEEINRENNEKRKELTEKIAGAEAGLASFVTPVKERLLAAKAKAFEAGDKKPVDLKPVAGWEFDGDLKSSVDSFDLKAEGKGKPTFADGMVTLDKCYLESPKLPMDLKAKTMEIWVKLPRLNQVGGGAMTAQGEGDFFDSIVFGERKAKHWISGSNGFSRTDDFRDSFPEETAGELLHLVMVYREDGSTLLYRNGEPYGKPFNKGRATFPANTSSILFGVRHLPPGGNKYLHCSIDKARLYDRALTAEEVAASSEGGHLYVSSDELVAGLTPDQRAKKTDLELTIKESTEALAKVPPNEDLKKMRNQAKKRYEDEIRGKLRASAFRRVPVEDPRYGGIITSAAALTMTSGPKRTKPISRGSWLIEVVFNDPPPPPPNDVPALDETAGPKNQTIREKFAKHREDPTCASCHTRIDPLGFALENFDSVGRWRDSYENNRDVDASGKMLKKYDFKDVVEFKAALVKEETRFAKAFTAHLMRYALARELGPADSLVVEDIVEKTAEEDHRLRSIIREIVLSKSFAGD